MGNVTITASNSLEITAVHSVKGPFVRLTGRINVDTSPDLRGCLLAILSAEPLPRTITVDLSGVPYIETSGIATLIEALRIARRYHIEFCLQGLSGAGLRLFEVTGVLALFEASGCGQKVP